MHLEYNTETIFQASFERACLCLIFVDCFTLHHYYQNKRHSRSAMTPQTDLAGMCLPEKSSAQGLSSREPCMSGTNGTDFRGPICCSESSLCVSQQDPRLLAGQEEKAASLLHDNNLCAHCMAKSQTWDCNKMRHCHKSVICRNTAGNACISPFCAELPTQCYQQVQKANTYKTSKYQQSQLLEVHAGRNSFVALLFI